ncbi:lipopolysaccharide biosynthesis protein [Labedella endophytica]|uniref:Lipopolysaccharide biosynthesis protein n=1 Tax=Labedella endophytica TaxID=1523160 RepID=A0A3S1CUI2_9MICO|nr:lipopolysaccharide biosynthesis protein [Labedella endophytica]RUR03473.1 lipopolysaccharide biosynthesis protein [Labedella endophytica]
MSARTAAAPAAGEFGRRAARGAAVTFIGQLIRIAVQIGGLSILARLLGATDYGLFAMVMVVVGVSEVFRDFGLSNAAVQAPTLSTRQRDVLFWVNSGIGLALGVVIVGVAYGVGALYGRPELIPLTQFMGITFVFNGLATQHRASLNRDLRFWSLTVIDTVAAVAALVVAIVLSLAGLGYWALAWQMVSLAAVTLILSVATARWLPRLPRRGTDMTGFYRFGWNTVATQLVQYSANNMASLVIGLRLGARELGFYNRSLQLLMNPLNQLRAPATRVAIPLFSRLQHEYDRFDAYILRGQIVLGYTLVAGLGLVAGAAEPVVAIFLGEKWAEVTPVLRFLIVAGAFQTLAYVAYWVFVSRALTGALFRFTLITASMKIAFVLIGSQWGVVGVAAGYALEPVLSWPLAIWWLTRYTRIPVRPLVLGVIRLSSVALVGGLAAFAASTIVAPAGPVVQILAATVADLVVYALAALVVPAVRRDVVELVQIANAARHRGPRPSPSAGAMPTDQEDLR